MIMNIVLAIMFIFLCLSVIDKIIGNRFGYGSDFDKGIATMGPVAMCMIGLYGLGTYVLENNSDYIANLYQTIPFDPSVIIGLILSTDLGSLPICLSMADTRAIGLFSGVVLGSTIGASISFSIPTCLSELRGKNDVERFLNGSAVGISVILPGAFITGLMYGLPGNSLLINAIPLMVICIALLIGFKLSPKLTSFIMGGFGKFVTIICMICFAVVAFGLLFPSYALVDPEFLGSAVLSTAKMSIIVVGSLSFTKFSMRHFNPLLKRLARIMKTNEYAVIGLVLSLTTCVAMIPIFKLMDNRGQQINAAFAISGSFIIGGQMSYTSSFVTADEMAGFFVCKGISAVLAVVFVCILDSKQNREAFSSKVDHLLNEENRRTLTMINSNENAVNIGLSCSESLMEAMENDSELNGTVNDIIERFLDADWGDISEEESDRNNSIIVSRVGNISAEYKTSDGDFSIEMTFSNKQNAIIMVDYL